MKIEIDNDLAIKTYLDKRKNSFVMKDEIIDWLESGYICQYIYDDVFRVHFDSFARAYFLDELFRIEIAEIWAHLHSLMSSDEFQVLNHVSFHITGCDQLLEVIRCDEFDIERFEPVIYGQDFPDPDQLQFCVTLKDKYAHLESK